MCPINKTIGFFIYFILISNQQQIGFFVLGGRGAKKNPSNPSNPSIFLGLVFIK